MYDRENPLQKPEAVASCGGLTLAHLLEVAFYTTARQYNNNRSLETKARDSLELNCSIIFVRQKIILEKVY